MIAKIWLGICGVDISCGVWLLMFSMGMTRCSVAELNLVWLSPVLARVGGVCATRSERDGAGYYRKNERSGRRLWRVFDSGDRDTDSASD